MLLEEIVSNVDVLLEGLPLEEQLIRYSLLLLRFSRDTGERSIFWDRNNPETKFSHEKCHDIASTKLIIFLQKAANNQMIDPSDIPFIVCGCAPSTGAISCAVSISLSDALISAIVILRSLPFCFIYSVGLLIPLCCIARNVAGVQRKCDHQFPQSFGPKSSPLLIAGDLGKMVEYWLDVWLGI